MTTILVTGATGYLGGHILKALQTLPDIKIVAACRTPAKLPSSFQGEIRVGDLLDPNYRRSVLHNIDVVCHAGGWGSLWGHAELEHNHFYLPTLDLIDQSINQGVKRFIQTSTVVIGPATRAKTAAPVDDFSLAREKTGFWPHVDYLMELDRYMRKNAEKGMQMVTMRLGHFVGEGISKGLLPMLLPRLKTHLVPWLDGGRMPMPLVTGEDMGRAFALTAVANTLESYESFNISGAEFPTMRQFFEFVAKEADLPKPHYSVSYPAAYAFAWLMEKLSLVLPGDPFLMQSIVFLSENWTHNIDYAQKKLGYKPQKSWQTAVREEISALKRTQYPWPQTIMPTDWAPQPNS